MKYKVLYRKYRPDDFENIVGQDYIIRTLRNSIIHNQISHAYIFSGPRGTGKTTTAKVFSKAINCLEPIDGSPCGKCEFCKNFQENPDIIEIDAASNNGVDEIRNLIDNVKLTPTNGKYKVYIIDEVHMLTTSAFNALLLTLEEPPAHTIFILATTNVENVPITILSRCQRFDFQKIKIVDLVDRLKKICELENIECEEDALKEIAYLSEGGLRDALSLLDQLSKSEQKITLELIENQIKSISTKGILDLLATIEENNVEKCLEYLNEYRARAVDYKTLVKKIIDVCSKKAKNIKKTGQFSRLDFDDYKNLIYKLAESISKININVDSYTILELILLEFFDILTESTYQKKSNLNVEKSEPKESITNLSTQQKAVEKSETNSVSKVDEDLIKIRINNCFVNAQKQYLENGKKDIEKYCSSVNVDGKIKSFVLDSILVAASDTNLIFTCSNEHNVDTANNNLIAIENSINKELNSNYKIIFISEERWTNERNQYIINLKNKVGYNYIDEKEMPEDIKENLNSVFDLSKVEII